MDIYQTVTDQIVAQIERGAGAYQFPWHRTDGGAMPRNATTGREYRGINVVALWCTQRTQLWASYKQWQSIGAQVRKGEKGSMVVYWGKAESKEIGDDGEPREYMFAKPSWVFSCDQVDGYTAPVVLRPALAQRIEAVEGFVAATGARVIDGGERAFYSPAADRIGMPARDRFRDTTHRSATEGYYGVMLHELTHWTGHEKRCNRNRTGRFGAAFACARLGLASEPRQDHAQYIARWLRTLKDDKRAIFAAASRASAAVDYLASLQSAVEPAAIAA